MPLLWSSIATIMVKPTKCQGEVIWQNYEGYTLLLAWLKFVQGHRDRETNRHTDLEHQVPDHWKTDVIESVITTPLNWIQDKMI